MFQNIMAEQFKPESRYGDWIRERQLGSGACGTVYMWKNHKKNEEIAIKKCKLLDNSDAMKRWETEVSMIKGMCHSNIVSYIEIPSILEKEYPKFCSLGMEFCSSGDLRKFIGRTEHGCGLPEYHMCDVLTDIGSAIHYLHGKHNMHRDLKPENIVLKPRLGCPNRFVFKITDLGYAKDLDITRGHTVVGTLQYLAPELFLEPKCNLNYNTEVDFWSFGMVAFECATGFRPFFHLSNSEPTCAINLVKDKRDEDVCAWHEGTNIKFYDGIPQPHLLNRHFANDVALWLRLMLCVNKEKRGGKDKEEWYTMLTEKVLAKKYVQVVNTTTMSVQVFSLEGSALPRTVQMKIQSETSVEVADQLLLLGKGEVLNMTKKLLEQLKTDLNSPDHPVIYFFDKRPRTCPQYRSTVPEIILQYQRNANAITDHKRFMQIVLHAILSKVKIGLHYCNAFFALVERVTKVSFNLKARLQEFLAQTNKFDGEVSLFELSLRIDMDEAERQRDVSEICVGDEYVKECELLLGDVESWKKEIVEARQLIKKAHGELLKNRSLSDLQNFKKQLNDIENDAKQFAHKFRIEYRKMEQNIGRPRNPNGTDRRNCAENNTKTQKSYFNYQVQKFRDVSALVEETISPQSDSRRKMRAYTDDLIKLEQVHFSMEDKKQRCSCLSSSLGEKQKRRQHSLWNMLKYMKDIYNVARPYQPDPTPEADLTNAQHRLRNFRQTLMEDQDLTAFLNFSPHILAQRELGVYQQPGSGYDHSQVAVANVTHGPVTTNSSQVTPQSQQLNNNQEASLQISSQNDSSSFPH